MEIIIVCTKHRKEIREQVYFDEDDIEINYSNLLIEHLRETLDMETEKLYIT